MKYNVLNNMHNHWLLFTIVLFALFLRFFQLGYNPPSLTWDEVAWGYNAYALGADLRDEFGRFLPIDYLESFGDFKPPMYAYLDIIPVKVFGLTEFATRFPSALFGVLTVLATYFLTKIIFPKAQKFSVFGIHFSVAEVAALFLAISPWHINLSRAAFEANVATFFIVCGVWLFISWVHHKKWQYLALSSFVFCLSFYTFNTARVVAPLLAIALGLGYWKSIIANKRHFFIALLTSIFVLFPIIGFLFSAQASLRFKEVNIFSDITLIERANQEIANANNEGWAKVIHNRRFTYVQGYIQHYLDNLNPRFLFIDGDGNPKFSTRDIGQLYLWELPFFIAGILLLIRRREGSWWIIPTWLLLGIIPAATARETPHALRIEATLPTFQILTAYGFIFALTVISNLKYKIVNIHVKYVLSAIIGFCLVLNVFYYLHGYYMHYPKQFSGEWQYGYKDAISYVKSVENEYKHIYITEGLGRPYAYTLFYTTYDPKQFRIQAKINRDAFGFVDVKSFGKYTFDRNISRFQSRSDKFLYIDLPGKNPSKAKILKKFYLLNGVESLVAYTL